jgi:uncharacterized protein
MQIPRYWRNQKQRYALVGEICPHCQAKLFPAHAVCPHCGSSLETGMVLAEVMPELAIAVSAQAPATVKVPVR